MADPVAAGGRHFNNLTPAQAERLALLAEECGEAIQAIGKILRHGYESTDPTSRAEYPETNRRTLAKEVGDIFAAVHMAVTADDFDYATVEALRDRKLVKVLRYLHHAK